MRSPYRYDSNGWLPPRWLRWLASVECCELDTGDTYCREEADPCRWWRVYWHAPGAEPVVEAQP